MYQTWHWFFQECWVLVLLRLDCVLMWKWSDCNPRVLGLTISKQSHWLCKKKNNYGKKNNFGRPQPWVTTEHHHFHEWPLLCPTEWWWTPTTTPQATARFRWLKTKVKGPTSSTQKTFQRTTREDLKDENSSPKLLCITLTTENPHRCFVRLFKKYNALCPYNRNLKVHFILHHYTKESQRELLHVLGETNLLKQFPRRAVLTGELSCFATCSTYSQGSSMPSLIAHTRSWTSYCARDISHPATIYQWS